MSSEEICKMKWKSIEIIDVGRISKSKAIEEYEHILDEIREEGKEDEIYICLNFYSLNHIRQLSLINYIDYVIGLVKLYCLPMLRIN